MDRIPYAIITRHYKELSSASRLQFLFLCSSLAGTVLFFVLFECLHRINSYNLERAETAFTLSYIGAYLVSIVWQHALNRYFLFSNTPYCSSLLHTYLVYSVSLLTMALAGNAIVRIFRLPARVVALITVLGSGFLNYHLLTKCLSNGEGSSQSKQRVVVPKVQSNSLAV